MSRIRIDDLPDRAAANRGRDVRGGLKGEFGSYGGGGAGQYVVVMMQQGSVLLDEDWNTRGETRWTGRFERREPPE